MKTAAKRKCSRREFLGRAALAGAAFTIVPARILGLGGEKAPSDKLNIAGIGIGGQGSSDLAQMRGENIVALCDVDWNYAGKQFKIYPDAKQFRDFRKMLDEMKEIDAVVIATPDHHHAFAAMEAIKHGKHIYCEKPLTHSVWEARELARRAREAKVATQMGNQGQASEQTRRLCEYVWAGAIGKVHEAHIWTDRPSNGLFNEYWPQGVSRPKDTPPVPSSLDWDLWLGPAPARPFHSAYLPFKWRGWWDFGTGALGDMACHTVNWPFRALNLGYPTEIEAESSGMNKEMYPAKSKIRFEFPARNDQPAVTFWWFDGGNTPPNEVTADILAMQDKISGSGCLLVGDKGQVFSPDDGDQDLRFFLKLKDDKEMTRGSEHEAVKAIPESLPRNAFKGPPDQRQHLEWIAACKGGKPPYSNFDTAAYLTEIILLGCVALRTGKKLEWDGPGMKAKNAPEAAQFVKRSYRKGWEL